MERDPVDEDFTIEEDPIISLGNIGYTFTPAGYVRALSFCPHCGDQYISAETRDAHIGRDHNTHAKSLPAKAEVVTNRITEAEVKGSRQRTREGHRRYRAS